MLPPQLRLTSRQIFIDLVKHLFMQTPQFTNTTPTTAPLPGSQPIEVVVPPPPSLPGPTSTQSETTVVIIPVSFYQQLTGAYARSILNKLNDQNLQQVQAEYGWFKALEEQCVFTTKNG